MNDDYLWDRTGKPDTEVERLERLLGQFRHRHPAPAWPRPLHRLQPRALLALAATLALVAAGAWLATRPVPGGWEVVRVEGAPTLGRSRVETKTNLAVSEWLETDSASRARLESLIGRVEVEPNSRIRLLAARTSEHRLELRRGTIQASIWAPPRQFFVETPAAVAVDLGCTYRLEVEPDGAGRLAVTSGWVAFEYEGRESFIPAGAMCATRPRVGPGTPYFANASAEFKAALARLDFETLSPEERGAAFERVLGAARRQDGLSLWHLLGRVNAAEQGHVYDRLAQLVPPPRGVTREGVLGGERRMLDLWWDELGLGDASWFRFWKGSWPPRGRG